MTEFSNITSGGQSAVLAYLPMEDFKRTQRLGSLRDTKLPWVSNKRSDGTLIKWVDHAHGLRGEHSVADFLGVEVNETHYIDGGNRGEPDLYYKGHGIAVCTADAPSPKLIFPNWKRFAGDWAVLCKNKGGRYTREQHWVVIEGVIQKDRFARRYRMGNFGNGLVMYVPRWELMPIRDWVKLIG